MRIDNLREYARCRKNCEDQYYRRTDHFTLPRRGKDYSPSRPPRQQRQCAAASKGPSRGIGAPYGTRTRVTAVKGRCPGPLDEGRERCAMAQPRVRGDIERFAGTGNSRFGGGLERPRAAPPHHFPVLGIDFHGSLGGSASPFCRSSMDCLSGERTNAIMPSRGGRLMVTPAFMSLSQTA